MRIKFLLKTIIFILVSISAKAQVDLARGLTAYYPFNGNANDVSGNGLNGIERNGIQLTTDKYGNANSAYLFDGIDDYIEILDDPKLRFRDSFSVCISYMKLSQPGGNLIEKRQYNTGTNTSFDMAAGSGGANGAVKTGDMCADAVNGASYTLFTQPPVLNRWYCIVMTFNSGTLKFYEDGVLISSTTTTGNTVDSCSGSSIRIGRHLSFDPIPMHGKIDEVRLYDRDLNQDEINTLCNTTTNTCNTNWLNVPDKLTGVSIGELDITGNQLTVEAMCNATDIYDLSRSLVSKHGWDANCNYFLCPDLAQITTNQGFFSATSPCSFVSNKTYHVAMVYNGTSLRLYRDGFLMQEVPASGNLVNNNWPAIIGEYAYAMFFSNVSISNVFKGYINEVRIWNIARTQQQIQDYMNVSLPAPTTQSGLLAYYTFDNLLNKQGNAAYNGTLRGAATINNTNPNCDFVADSCPVVNTSCSTWLNVPNKLNGVSIGELDIAGNQITVEAMCNATDIYDLSRSLVSKHGWEANCNYFLCPDLAQITTDQGFFSATSPCSFISNKTYHVAMVYNGSTLRLYRNGFLMQEVPANGNLYNNNWPAVIGEYAYAVANNNVNISNVFKGYINEVRIWNVARTQQEIQDYMNVPLTNPATQTGLQAYYTFDNLLNKQGNAAYNGTLLGGATINATNTECDFIADSCLTVLPVSITSFTTTVSNNKNILVNWNTEQENGIVKYFVQRSLFANSGFETIGTVNANNPGRNNYSFTDNNVKPNTRYFYRLLIIENTGVSKYSVVRSERISSQLFYTSLYPNPTSGSLVFTVGNYTGNASLTVFNNLGQAIYTKSVMINNNTSIPLELSRQPKGSYWLQMVMNNERIVKKIIKQ